MKHLAAPALPALALIPLVAAAPDLGAQPDLIPIKLEVNTTVFEEGKSVTVDLRVRQTRFLQWSGACTLGLYVSRDATWDKNDIGVKQLGVPSLGWLGEAYWKGPVQIPFLWDGPGYLIMFVDNQNQVKEYSETNNFKSVAVTCVTQRPDLIATALTAGTSLAGNPSTLRVTIKNQGSVSSVAFKIRYYCSLDTRITTADTLVGTFNVSGLGAGKSTALQHQVTIPSTHHLGLAWMGVVLDYDNKVDERSETNNTRVDYYWCYRVPQHYRRYTY